MSPAEAAFLVSATASACGAGCLWWGRRGRRVGDHLHCSKCEHDLFGLPWDAPRCPECGALIKYGRPKGRLAQRPKFVQAGAIVLAIALPVLLAVIYTQVRGTKLIEHAPLWYVMQRINVSAAAPAGDDYLEELIRRIQANAIMGAELSGVVSQLIDYQASEKRPWSPKVGKLIERLRSRGLVPDREWKRYLENGAIVSAFVRPFTQHGDPIAAALFVQRGRFGDWSGEFVLSVDQVRIDEKLVTVDRTRGEGRLVGGGVERLGFATDAPLTAGEHEMAIDYTLAVTPPTLQPVIGTPVPTTAAAIAGTRHGNLKVRFMVREDHVTLLPTTVDGFETINITRNRGTTPNIRPPVLRWLANGDLEVNIGAIGVQGIVLAYDVSLRQGETEQHLGSFSVRHDQSGKSGWTNFAWTVSDIPPSTRSADVVLRPSRDLAVRDAEATRYRSTEYIFRELNIGR